MQYVLCELTLIVGAVHVNGLVFAVVHNGEAIHTPNADPVSTRNTLTTTRILILHDS